MTIYITPEKEKEAVLTVIHNLEDQAKENGWTFHEPYLDCTSVSDIANVDGDVDLKSNLIMRSVLELSHNDENLRKIVSTLYDASRKLDEADEKFDDAQEDSYAFNQALNGAIRSFQDYFSMLGDTKLQGYLQGLSVSTEVLTKLELSSAEKFSVGVLCDLITPEDQRTIFDNLINSTDEYEDYYAASVSVLLNFDLLTREQFKGLLGKYRSLNGTDGNEEFSMSEILELPLPILAYTASDEMRGWLKEDYPFYNELEAVANLENHQVDL